MMAFITGRVATRVPVTATLLAVALVLSFSTSALADEEFPDCDGRYEGARWTDPQSGIEFECRFQFGKGYGWHLPNPKPPATDENDAITYLDSFSQLGVYQVSTIGGPTFGHASSVYPRTGDGVTPIGKNAGWLSVRTILNYHNGSAWVTCRDSNWRYNQHWAVSWVVGMQSAGPWCGSGWYYGDALGFVWDGSLWRGGSVLTPQLFMSDDGFAAEPPPPPADAPDQTTRPGTPPPPPR